MSFTMWCIQSAFASDLMVFKVHKIVHDIRHVRYYSALPAPNEEAEILPHISYADCPSEPSASVFCVF